MINFWKKTRKNTPKKGADRQTHKQTYIRAFINRLAQGAMFVLHGAI